jgi:hypothetical protein
MTLYGVDVSTYQLPSAIPFGVDFVIARATFGTKLDKRTAEHAKHCRGRCAFGMYHFFVPGQNVDDQRDAFAMQAASCDLTVGDVIPWIDVESPKGDGSMPPRPEWCQQLYDLAHALTEGFGAVGFYISQRDWSLLGKPAWILEHPLWVPHWLTISTAKVASPGGVAPTIHQYRVGPYIPGALHVGSQVTAPDAIDHDRCLGELPRIVADDEPVQPQPAPVPVVDPTLELTDDDWLAMRAERDRQIAEDNQ